MEPLLAEEVGKRLSARATAEKCGESSVLRWAQFRLRVRNDPLSRLLEHVGEDVLSIDLRNSFCHKKKRASLAWSLHELPRVLLPCGVATTCQDALLESPMFNRFSNYSGDAALYLRGRSVERHSLGRSSVGDMEIPVVPSCPRLSTRAGSLRTPFAVGTQWPSHGGWVYVVVHDGDRATLLRATSLPAQSGTIRAAPQAQPWWWGRGSPTCLPAAPCQLVTSAIFGTTPRLQSVSRDVRCLPLARAARTLFRGQRPGIELPFPHVLRDLCCVADRCISGYH